MWFTFDTYMPVTIHLPYIHTLGGAVAKNQGVWTCGSICAGLTMQPPGLQTHASHLHERVFFYFQMYIYGVKRSVDGLVSYNAPWETTMSSDPCFPFSRGGNDVMVVRFIYLAPVIKRRCRFKLSAHWLRKYLLLSWTYTSVYFFIFKCTSMVWNGA